MPSRTVSLEASAYERLKAAKRPGESFTITVNRILEGSRPTFRSLAGFLSGEEAKQVRGAIKRMRDAEAPAELEHLVGVKRYRGPHPRH